MANTQNLRTITSSGTNSSSQADAAPWGPAVDSLSAGQREEGVLLHAWSKEHAQGTLPAGTLQGNAVPDECPPLSLQPDAWNHIPQISLF